LQTTANFSKKKVSDLPSGDEATKFGEQMRHGDWQPGKQRLFISGPIGHHFVTFTEELWA
jgi:hypothetical protein